MTRAQCLLAAISMAAACAAAGQASAQDCGRYVVQPGDSLHDIAIARYGDREAAWRIYDLNSGLIGGNPDIIEKGIVLRLPCGGLIPAAGDGATSALAPDETTAATHDTNTHDSGADMASGTDQRHNLQQGADHGEDMADHGMQGGDGPDHVGPQDGDTHEMGAAGHAAAPAHDMAEGDAHAGGQGHGAQTVVETGTSRPAVSEEAGLALVSYGPFSPFSGSTLPEQGMFTALIRAALDAAPQKDGEPAADIAFVNDPESHLDSLFPRGAFDVGFPWVWPDCAAAALTPNQQRLCDGYVASAPFYEFAIEVYARADGRFAAARFPADLTGAVMCRPEGYPVDDLISRGLLPGKIELRRAPDPRACLELLDAGTVDLASMDASATRALAQDMTLATPLLVLDGLTVVETLHAIAPKGSARGRAGLARLDLGLQRIGDSGAWFDIVQRHLDAGGQAVSDPGADEPGTPMGADHGETPGLASHGETDETAADPTHDNPTQGAGHGGEAAIPNAMEGHGAEVGGHGATPPAGETGAGHGSAGEDAHSAFDDGLDPAEERAAAVRAAAQLAEERFAAATPASNAGDPVLQDILAELAPVADTSAAEAPSDGDGEGNLPQIAVPAGRGGVAILVPAIRPGRTEKEPEGDGGYLAPFRPGAPGSEIMAHAGGSPAPEAAAPSRTPGGGGDLRIADSFY